MSFAITGTVLAVGGSIYSANKQSSAATDAANTQANAARDANATQLEMFNRSADMQAPWRQAGSNALSQIQGALGGQEWSRPFDASMMRADPGYQFRLDQGGKALQRQLSAGGKYFSGGALKEMQGYTQGLASQEFGNAFNRFQTDRQNRLNPLMSLAGLGQGSAAQVGSQGVAVGNSIGNNLMAAGDAQAAGRIGSANAQAGMFNNLYGFMKQNPWNVYSGTNAPISASTPTIVNNGWQGGDWG